MRSQTFPVVYGPFGRDTKTTSSTPTKSGDSLLPCFFGGEARNFDPGSCACATEHGLAGYLRPFASSASLCVVDCESEESARVDIISCREGEGH